MAQLGSQAYPTLGPGRQGWFVEAWGLWKLILRKQLPLHFSSAPWWSSPFFRSLPALAALVGKNSRPGFWSLDHPPPGVY